MSSVFLSRTAPVKSKAEKKISSLAKRISTRARDVKKPSECVVIVYKKD